MEIEKDMLEAKMDQILHDVKNKAEPVHAWDYHKTYMSACASVVEVDGLWMEFGVYRSNGCYWWQQ